MTVKSVVWGLVFVLVFIAISGFSQTSIHLTDSSVVTDTAGLPTLHFNNTSYSYIDDIAGISYATPSYTALHDISIVDAPKLCATINITGGITDV